MNETSFSTVGDVLPLACVNLKGRWLEESGFMTGMPITVTVERGRIVIETEINV
ncbi:MULTISPECIES: SymE family type I addiction module toxin [Dickeya]|uniref:SymE family type I addiction module toxin n=1 Tax=Dickeya TaxID=204037 RepID=UPI00210F469C|nr:MULTISPECIES: SymE family type I addiction module toxin [Dickeya]